MTCLGYIWSDQNSYFWIIDSGLGIFIYLNDWSLIEQQIEIWTKINKEIFSLVNNNNNNYYYYYYFVLFENGQTN